MEVATPCSSNPAHLTHFRFPFTDLMFVKKHCYVHVTGCNNNNNNYIYIFLKKLRGACLIIYYRIASLKTLIKTNYYMISVLLTFFEQIECPPITIECPRYL